jgi:phosphoribosylamine---glycine ligase
MNVLIIGNGGREHAIAHALKKSTALDKIFVAPGNCGTESIVSSNVDIKVNDFAKLEEIVNKENIELIIVGPELPLVEGIYDYFTERGIAVVGPSQKAAQLEGSKAFAKKFMQAENIPTAAYLEVTAENLVAGLQFLESLQAPYVLKADGLAAGKGVLIIDDINEAKDELKSMLDGKFGSASTTVVIEEFLSGVEFSVFAITDGKNYVLLPEAKDYKRIGEGDTGLNTGGMGAVSPVPFFDDAMKAKVIERIVEPTIKGFAKHDLTYKGFVFFGLINVNGNPMVIEYNCRMGDPETEVVLPRVKSDLLPLFLSLKDQTLDQHSIEITNDTAVTVVVVSGGYPGDYKTNFPITLPYDTTDRTIVFHSGTKRNDGQVVSNGGRVLAVTSFGSGIQAALDHSYATITDINFTDMFCRKDIGQDLIKLQADQG